MVCIIDDMYAVQKLYIVDIRKNINDGDKRDVLEIVFQDNPPFYDLISSSVG